MTVTIMIVHRIASMKNFMFILLTMSTSCKRSDEGSPPPVTAGKCVVDSYHLDKIVKQSCSYSGYAWSCNASQAGADWTCERGGEVTSEQHPVIQDAQVPVAPDAPAQDAK